MLNSTLLTKYADVVRNLDLDAISKCGSLPDSLLILKEGRLTAYYAPFDWTNTNARIVLVGITPGFSQALLALRAAQSGLRSGMSVEDALRHAKRTGGFGGEIRKHLVALLDHFEINRWAGMPSCAELFGSRSSMLHTTSLLRFATFVGGENYNGSPAILKTDCLRRMLLEHFARELVDLPNAIFVPLGPKVSEVMKWLASTGHIDQTRILEGLPHPSPANLERINYVLGLKPRSSLSVKTNAAKLDEAAEALRARIQRLPTMSPA